MLASSTKPKRKGDDQKSRRKRNIKNQRETKARNGTAQFIHSWIAIECLKASSPNMKRKSQSTKKSRDDTLQQNGNGKSANLPEMETFLEKAVQQRRKPSPFPKQ
jgi:hypothetical protein